MCAIPPFHKLIVAKSTSWITYCTALQVIPSDVSGAAAVPSTNNQSGKRLFLPDVSFWCPHRSLCELGRYRDSSRRWTVYVGVPPKTDVEIVMGLPPCE